MKIGSLPSREMILLGVYPFGLMAAVPWVSMAVPYPSVAIIAVTVPMTVVPTNPLFVTVPFWSAVFDVMVAMSMLFPAMTVSIMCIMSKRRATHYESSCNG
ncbi:MAG: hypothetical protein ACPG47_07590 [Leucothrix sp.]